MEGRELFPQHARLIERAAERHASDPATLAVVVGGSIAHGIARPESDVDLMLVVSDEELARRESLTFSDASLADYEGGYVDGKLVSPGFLAEVAQRGSEPARWAFEDAFVVFSRVDGLDAALVAAAAYPEDEREQKLDDFVAHAVMATWFLAEAEKRDDPYLTSYAVSRFVLYAGRAVLAHNRRLFPFHKWFLHELRRAPKQPPGLVDGLEELLRAPSRDRADELLASVQDLVGRRPELAESAGRFLRRTEWSWRDGSVPLEES